MTGRQRRRCSRRRACLMAAAGFASGWVAAGHQDPLFNSMKNVSSGGGAPGAESQHVGLTIERIAALSDLVTVRVDVADVQETTLAGRGGAIRAALLIKGDFLLGTDLSQAKLQQVDAAARTAVLVLPQPTARSPRLDQERTRLFALTESGLWRVTPGDRRVDVAVVNRAYRDAQRFVAAAAEDSAVVDRSRRQAEQVLVSFMNALGWQVSVDWAGRNHT